MKKLCVIITTLVLSLCSYNCDAQVSKFANRLWSKVTSQNFVKKVARRVALSTAFGIVTSDNYEDALEAGFYQSHSQMTMYGYVPLYSFSARNRTDGTLSGKLYVVDGMTGYTSSYSFVLYPNEFFTFGPDNGWTWLQGETATIEFSNGEAYRWTF